MVTEANFGNNGRRELKFGSLNGTEDAEYNSVDNVEIFIIVATCRTHLLSGCYHLADFGVSHMQSMMGEKNVKKMLRIHLDFTIKLIYSETCLERPP